MQKETVSSNSRRKFLKASVIISLAPYIVPSSVFGKMLRATELILVLLALDAFHAFMICPVYGSMILHR